MHLKFGIISTPWYMNPTMVPLDPTWTNFTLWFWSKRNFFGNDQPIEIRTSTSQTKSNKDAIDQHQVESNLVSKRSLASSNVIQNFHRDDGIASNNHGPELSFDALQRHFQCAIDHLKTELSFLKRRNFAGGVGTLYHLLTFMHQSHQIRLLNKKWSSPSS